MSIYIPDGVIIGHRIRSQRKFRDMTQDELATLVGTNARQVWRWESGDNIPRADMLGAIAQALGTSTDYLLGIQARFNLENLSHDELTIIIKLRHGDKLGVINHISRQKPYKEGVIDNGVEIEKGNDESYPHISFTEDD